MKRFLTKAAKISSNLIKFDSIKQVIRKLSDARHLKRFEVSIKVGSTHLKVNLRISPSEISLKPQRPDSPLCWADSDRLSFIEDY